MTSVRHGDQVGHCRAGGRWRKEREGGRGWRDEMRSMRELFGQNTFPQREMLGRVM